MQTFNFPYHTVETEYPQSSITIKFGNSWDFVTKPNAPDQRTFTLHFTGFKYYTNQDGTIDSTTNANINNMAALDAFYQSVRLFDKFIYPHPIYGNVTVRFKNPLKIPKGLPDGGGVLDNFDVTLIEQP